jgi:hypothetical protein
MEQREEIRPAMAAIIRNRSDTGQLLDFEQLLAELVGQGFLSAEMGPQRSHYEEVFRQVIEENEDIREISGTNGIPHYYSAGSLSDTYARILIRKEENSLIAEIVRENSAVYPRPVSLNVFEDPPFDLTREQILDCLEAMASQEEFQDILQTTTSIGTVFLYSDRYLDSTYASTLAEWLDVGQVSNP